jgi:hypothetical protein
VLQILNVFVLEQATRQERDCRKMNTHRGAEGTVEWRLGTEEQNKGIPVTFHFDVRAAGLVYDNSC